MMKTSRLNIPFKPLFLIVVALALLISPLPAYDAAAFSPPNTPGPFCLGGMAVFEDQLYVGFTWVDNSDNETGFRIEQKQGVEGTYSVILTVGANFTSMGGINVPRDGSTYLFRIKAFNASGESAPSNEVAIDTDIPAQVPPPMPNTPIAFQIGGIAAFPTYLALGFTWVDNSQDETGFRIEQKQGSGAFFVVATVPANQTNVGGIIIPRDGQTYFFRIKAFNANGESAPSNTVSIVASP
jgi:titin